MGGRFGLRSAICPSQPRERVKGGIKSGHGAEQKSASLGMTAVYSGREVPPLEGGGFPYRRDCSTRKCAMCSADPPRRGGPRPRTVCRKPSGASRPSLCRGSIGLNRTWLQHCAQGPRRFRELRPSWPLRAFFGAGPSSRRPTVSFPAAMRRSMSSKSMSRTRTCPIATSTAPPSARGAGKRENEGIRKGLAPSLNEGGCG